MSKKAKERASFLLAFRDEVSRKVLGTCRLWLGLGLELGVELLH